MNECLTLNTLKPLQSARITNMINADGVRRRLHEIGLIEGTLVTCLFVSPMGDPTAYLIRGAVIALREDDTSGIVIGD